MDIRTALEAHIRELSGIAEPPGDRDLIRSGILKSIQLLDLINFVAEQFELEVDERDVYEGRFATIDAIAALVTQRRPRSSSPRGR